MGFFPFQPQTLPLSGGTLTGTLNTAGIVNTGTITSTNTISTSALAGITANGGFDVNFAGVGLRVAEGSNAKQGTTGAMTAGAITVADTSVTANSRIFVCRSAGGTNPGAWYVSAQTVGTSFVATSTNAADTGNGVFEIFEPG